MANLIFTLTGGASNSDPNASLGGVGSSVELSNTALNNLFDDVTPAQAASGVVEYRAIDILNNGTNPATSVNFFFGAQSSSPNSDLAAGLDATTQTIADEATAPSGVTFTAPTQASPLSVSDILVNGRQRVWIRRTVSAGAANTSNDLGQLSVSYA